MLKNMSSTITTIKGMLRDRDILFRYVNSLNSSNAYIIIPETGRVQNVIIRKTNINVEVMLIDIERHFYHIEKFDVKYDWNLFEGAFDQFLRGCNSSLRTHRIPC